MGGGGGSYKIFPFFALQTAHHFGSCESSHTSSSGPRKGVSLLIYGRTRSTMHEDHPFTLTHNVAYHGPWTLSESRKRCMSRVV